MMDSSSIASIHVEPAPIPCNTNQTISPKAPRLAEDFEEEEEENKKKLCLKDGETGRKSNSKQASKGQYVRYLMMDGRRRLWR